MSHPQSSDKAPAGRASQAPAHILSGLVSSAIAKAGDAGRPARRGRSVLAPLTRTRPRSIAYVLTIGISTMLGGCSENTDLMRAVGWFSPQTAGAPQVTVLSLPENSSDLGVDGIEGALRNAMELARAKRLAEARAVMADLASQTSPDSELWRSIKCSEMTLALRGNDLPALIESAEAVERNLRDPLRPPPECVVQLSIARSLRGRPLPINAPDGVAAVLQSVPRTRDVRTTTTETANPGPGQQVRR